MRYVLDQKEFDHYQRLLNEERLGPSNAPDGPDGYFAAIEFVREWRTQYSAENPGYLTLSNLIYALIAKGVAMAVEEGITLKDAYLDMAAEHGYDARRVIWAMDNDMGYRQDNDTEWEARKRSGAPPFDKPAESLPIMSYAQVMRLADNLHGKFINPFTVIAEDAEIAYRGLTNLFVDGFNQPFRELPPRAPQALDPRSLVDLGHVEQDFKAHVAKLWDDVEVAIDRMINDGAPEVPGASWKGTVFERIEEDLKADGVPYLSRAQMNQKSPLPDRRCVTCKAVFSWPFKTQEVLPWAGQYWHDQCTDKKAVADTVKLNASVALLAGRLVEVGSIAEEFVDINYDNQYAAPE